MADNITIPTTGSGTATPVIATDDVSGVHYQYVKLVDGTGNGTDGLPGTAANGLDVDVTRVSGTVSVQSNSANIATEATLSTLSGNVTKCNTDSIAGTVTANAGTGSFTVAQATAANLNATVTGTVAVSSVAAGDNNIGNVDIASAIPAGDNVVGRVKISDGTEVASVDTSNRLEVAVGNTPTVTVGTMAALVAGTAKIGGVDLDSDATPGSAVPAVAQYVAGTDGTNARGLKTDTSGELQVDVLTLPSNASVNVAQYNGATVSNTNPVFTANLPTTAGGCAYTNGHLISTASTNATVVKASAGQLYGWSVTNTNAAARYLKFHNSATTPTAGTGVVFTVGIPATSGSNFEIAGGIAFSTGIAFTTVTGIADSDNAAVGASDLNINLFYK